MARNRAMGSPRRWQEDVRMNSMAGGPTIVAGDELALDDLDVRIVDGGDVAGALQCSTDNGCDTVRGSDC